MPVTFNQAYWQHWNENRDGGDHGGCGDAPGTISRHRKGRRGRRRHWCQTPLTPYVSHDVGQRGSNPCTLAGADSAQWVGGGRNGDNHNSDYLGKSTTFNNAEAVLKCNFSYIDSAKLVAISENSEAMNSGFGDTTQWKQLVFGASTPLGNNSEGFCSKIGNLATKIHTDGRTCYDTITEAVTQKAKGIQWCASNPTDERCACINVAQHGTAGCVDDYPDLPGCREVKAEFEKFPAAAISEFDVKNFTPKCFMPNICSRSGQYLPNSEPDVCSQAITVCTQDLALYGDITGGAKVSIQQDMNCSTSADNSSGGDSGGGGGGDSGGGGGGGGGDEEEVVSLSDFTSNPGLYIPNSLEGLKTNRKQQIGAGSVGGLLMIICCVMLILVAVSSGGGGGGGPFIPTRFKRR